MKSTLRQCFPFLLLLGVACEPEALAPARTTCVSDAECGTAAACLLGICVDPRSQRLDEVDLEIRPSEDGGFRPQQRMSVHVGPQSEDERVSVELRETVTARGNVVDGTQTSVGARVVAVPESGIPGRALVSTASSSGPMGGFALPLVAIDPDDVGGAYQVAIFPEDNRSRPPHYLMDEIRPYDVEMDFAALSSIQLPEPTSLIAIQGQVLAGDAQEQIPIADMEVRAFEGTRRISSVGLTDAEGNFVLYLPPDHDEFLELELRPTESNRLNPVTRLDAWLPEDGSRIILAPLEEPVTLSGVVRSPSGEPVGGARIYACQEFHSRDRMSNFRALITTNEDGSYETELRPGVYDFAILPPPGENEAGLLVGFSAEVGDTNDPQFLLPERLDLQGEATTADGAPLVGAEIRLTRIGAQNDESERALDEIVWTFQTFTGMDGDFALRVDPGRYRLLILPDPGAGLPRETRVIDVTASVYDARYQLLPKAFVLGQVSVRGEAVPGAQITAFSSILDESGEPIELGSTLVSQDGKFEIVVPDLQTEPASFFP